MSSYLNKPIAHNVAFIGDISLNGEVKEVNSFDKRLKEGQRIFETIFISEYQKAPKGKQIRRIGQIQDLFK